MMRASGFACPGCGRDREAIITDLNENATKLHLLCPSCEHLWVIEVGHTVVHPPKPMEDPT